MVDVELDEELTPRVVTPGPWFWRVVAQIEAGFIVLCLLLTSANAGVMSSAYDTKFQQATAMYLPMWDWRWGKAQCYQESRLNPTAVSPVGALGLCQFMPATAREIFPKVGHIADPRAVEPSILAWGYYMATLRRVWRSERPEGERRRLAQASYNAGAGNILRAQKICGNPRNWGSILPCLPGVTGVRNAKETTGYVERIERWYWSLL
jgi:membrane-bound lytic murein transglycosylase MltF